MSRLPLVLALLTACTGSPDDTDTDTDTTPPPPLTDIPTGGCGADPYDWVPLDQVGDVISWERAAELDVNAPTIGALLGAAGFPADRLNIQYDVEVYRMRYLTQDRGETVEATAIVSFPDADGDFPTVAWLHGTTGFADACAPSGDGLEGAAGNLLLSSLGNVVISPDYLGMNGYGDPSESVHPYIVAEPTAVASLDAIRAGWRLAELVDADAQPTPKTVLFGGLEGGFAALWSELYAPWYLPSADIAAVVASVPPSDTLGLATHGALEIGSTSRALAIAMTTWVDWYGFDAPLTDILTDEAPNFVASTLPGLLETDCSPGSSYNNIDDVADLYVQPFRDAAAAGTLADYGDWGCAFTANSLATAPFERISDAPILYVISGDDQLVYHETNRADVPRLCAMGYDLEIIECADASHTQGALDSLHLQWRWAEERLAGEPVNAECALPTPIDCAAAP